MKNAKGEKDMKHHQATVRGAKKALTKETASLKKDIGKKMSHALKQDAGIMKDMKRGKC